MNKIKIFRKVNSKCQIKGCRSNGRKTDTFYVSASEGYGPSAILCEDCIKSLYERLAEKTEMPNLLSKPVADEKAETEEISEENTTTQSAELTTPLAQEDLEEAALEAPKKTKQARSKKAE